MRERLQKILARAGVDSRRNVEELIRLGRVEVNGRVASLGDRADLAADSVRVDGRRIRPPSPRRSYLVLHKPRGVVSTVKDPQGRPTVLDLLPSRWRKGLFPVGRLDYESEGLLLLTDDGDLAQRLTHPRYGCRKTYLAKVKGMPEEASLQKLRDGILLDGRRTAPALIRWHSNTGSRESRGNSWWMITLSEGRNRQVREMFFRIGHPVLKLRRITFGPLKLEGLEKGRWRELSEAEIEALVRAADPQAAKGKGRKPASHAVAKKPRKKGAGKPAAKRSGDRKAGARRGERGNGAPRKAKPRQPAPGRPGSKSRGRRGGSGRS